MALRWGKQCDGCKAVELYVYRHKCLRCKNFDLCRTCFGNKVVTGTHKRTHKFQLLLKDPSHGLTFEGVSLMANNLSCPLCGVIRDTVSGLKEHVTAAHTGIRKAVICPLCVSKPSMIAVRVRNFAYHMFLAHHDRIPRPSRFPVNAYFRNRIAFGRIYSRLTGRGTCYNRIRTLAIIYFGRNVFIQMYQCNRSVRIQVRAFVGGLLPPA